MNYQDYATDYKIIHGSPRRPQSKAAWKVRIKMYKICYGIGYNIFNILNGVEVVISFSTDKMSLIIGRFSHQTIFGSDPKTVLKRIR